MAWTNLICLLIETGLIVRGAHCQLKNCLKFKANKNRNMIDTFMKDPWRAGKIIGSNLSRVNV